MDHPKGFSKSTDEWSFVGMCECAGTVEVHFDRFGQQNAQQSQQGKLHQRELHRSLPQGGAFIFWRLLPSSSVLIRLDVKTP